MSCREVFGCVAAEQGGGAQAGGEVGGGERILISAAGQARWRGGDLRAYGRRMGSVGGVAGLIYALAASGSELNSAGMRWANRREGKLHDPSNCAFSCRRAIHRGSSSGSFYHA